MRSAVVVAIVLADVALASAADHLTTESCRRVLMRGDNSHAEQLAASDFLAQCEHEVGMARKGQLSIQEAWQVIVELHDEYRKRVFFHERTGEELGE